MMLINSQVPGDSSGTAIGVAIPHAFLEKLVAGLQFVREALPTLSVKAEELIRDFTDLKNPMAAQGYRLAKIDRTVDLEYLSREKRIKVLDCDKQKILALAAALTLTGGEGTQIAEQVLTTFLEGGIPIKVDGEPAIGKSVFIRLFDESLELRITRAI